MSELPQCPLCGAGRKYSEGQGRYYCVVFECGSCVWPYRPEQAQSPRCEIVALRSQVAATQTAMVELRDYIRKANGHWDADEDHKVGKMLAAMAGYCPGYHHVPTKFNELVDAALKESQ